LAGATALLPLAPRAELALAALLASAQQSGAAWVADWAEAWVAGAAPALVVAVLAPGPEAVAAMAPEAEVPEPDRLPEQEDSAAMGIQ